MFISLFELAGYAIFLKVYYTFYSRKRLKLIRNPKKIKIVSESDLLKREARGDSKEIVSDRIESAKNDIYKFLRDSNVSDEVMGLVYNNLETISDKSNFINSIYQTFMNFDGSYRSSNHSISLNKILNKNIKIGKLTYLVNEEDLNRIITHELFHVASSYKVGNVTGSGFRSSDSSFGLGITEGCTDYLTSKLYSKVYSYPYEVKVIEIIKLIIGKNKLFDFYFKGNVSGLINELSKYQPREEVIQFICDVDTVSKARVERLSEFNNDILSLSYNRIKAFLYLLYSNKESMNRKDSSFYRSNVLMSCLFELDSLVYIENHSKGGKRR